MIISISLNFPSYFLKLLIVFLDDILEIHKWSALQFRIDDNQSLKRFSQRFIQFDHRHRVQQQTHKFIIHLNRFKELIGTSSDREGLQISEQLQRQRNIQ